MTNEELAARIQFTNDGADTDALLLELWQGVQGITFLKAAARASAVSRLHDIDDMLQEAYLILPEAVQYFDPTAGASFHTIYCTYFLPRAFDIALYGSRRRQSICDPLNVAQSLEAPLQVQTDEHSSTLLDTLIDENAETPYTAVDDISFWSNVSRFIDKGIDRLPDGQRQILRFIYENDSTTSEAHRCQVAGPRSRSRYGQLYRDGIRNLRHWIQHTAKDDAERIGIDTVTTRHYRSGLQSFKNHGFTSCTEMIALEHVAHEEHAETLRHIPDVLKPSTGGSPPLSKNYIEREELAPDRS